MSKKSNIPDKKQNQEIVIPQQLEKVIADLPKEKQTIVLEALIAKQHSGPLPDGETLRIYNEVIPNGGDRLMKTVENQVEHRMTLEKDAERRTLNQSGVGQVMGFVIAILFGLISWNLAMNGHDWVAGVLGTIDLGALVAVFIKGRKQ